jgi:hypothetical protein
VKKRGLNSYLIVTKAPTPTAGAEKAVASIIVIGIAYIFIKNCHIKKHS